MDHYYLGCPSWANKDWIGSLFTKGTSSKSMLGKYAGFFNTVEGNTTFYALPDALTVQRWKLDTPQTFKFTFKFPRTISHDLRLQNCQGELTQFLKLMEILDDKLGLLWLQLPPSFSFRDLNQIKRFLAMVSKDFDLCVEVRHLDFYDQGDKENLWRDLLSEAQVDWVHFDTVALFSQRSMEPSVIEAQRKKPRMPERFTATAKHPFIRFIADNDPRLSRDRIEVVANQVSQWIHEGKIPYVTLHTPDCVQCPETARLFHETLQQKVRVGTLKDWDTQHKPEQEQLSLF